jgi:hypothetical protein
MSDQFYTVHKVLFDKYIHLLSAEAFCTLVRFYQFFLNNYQQEGKDADVHYSVFKKLILSHDDHELNEEIWAELDYADLIKRAHKYNIYELNLSKINLENNTEKNQKFRIHLIGSHDKFRRKRGLETMLNNVIERFISRYNDKLKEKLRILINGCVEFLTKEKGKAELNDINFLLRPLLDVTDKMLDELCDIYNEQHYGQKPPQYIHGILKNIIKTETKAKGSKTFKEENLEKYRKQKEESDLEFGVNLALGKTENDESYQSYLDLKEFDDLKRLHKMGSNELEKSGRSDEIFRGYNWL